MSRVSRTGIQFSWSTKQDKNVSQNVNSRAAYFWKQFLLKYLDDDAMLLSLCQGSKFMEYFNLPQHSQP